MDLGLATPDPIVWEEALGANIRDVDGNVFVDLTGGFGVALVGHRHPSVVVAAIRQAARLPNAMGEAFADDTRTALLERLTIFAPPGLSVALLGLSDSDAIEAAAKTALLATGRTGVLTFQEASHGLVSEFSVTQLPWGCPAAQIRRTLASGTIGLVLVEPILSHGIRPPPDGWLAEVAVLARTSGAVVCLDEIQTGLGRTGAPFAGPADGVIPDLMCVGNALGGGFPLSACLGSPELMAHWGASKGQSIQTPTFLGQPVGCAAALAVLDLLQGGLVNEIRARGDRLAATMGDLGLAVRGRGLMLAVSVGPGRAVDLSRALLRWGYLVLPADADSLQLTPPVSLTNPQMAMFAHRLRDLE